MFRLLFVSLLAANAYGITLWRFPCTEPGFFPLIDETPEYFDCYLNKEGGINIRYMICRRDHVFRASERRCVLANGKSGGYVPQPFAGGDIENPTIPTDPPTTTKHLPETTTPVAGGETDPTTTTEKPIDSTTTDAPTTADPEESTTTEAGGETDPTTTTEKPIDSTTTDAPTTADPEESTTTEAGGETDPTTTTVKTIDSTTTDAPTTADPEESTTTEAGGKTDPTTTTEKPVDPTTTDAPPTVEHSTTTEHPEVSTTTEDPHTPTEDPETSTTTDNTEGTEPATPPTGFRCPSAGFFPQQGSCDSFLYCGEVNGDMSAYKFQCPPGQHYNPITEFCDGKFTCNAAALPDTQILQELEQDFECLVEGAFADRNNCAKYYSCLWNNSIGAFEYKAMQCPAGKVFHVLSGKCDRQGILTCLGR